MPISQLVAGNLRSARERKKLTQAGLAEKVKLSAGYISTLERGTRTPLLDTLEALAKVLGVDPIDLLRER